MTEKNVSTDGGRSIWCSTRFGIAYVLFAVTFTEHIKRFSISLTIIAMTTDDAVENITLSHVNTTFGTNTTMTSTNDTAKVTKYAWDRETRGNILAAYFYGYTVSMIITGLLINKCGARLGIGVTQFFSGLLQFILPQAAAVGPLFFAFLRVFDGLLTGFVFVGCCNMLGSWSVPKERGKYATVTLTPTWLGIMTGFTLSGVISSSPLQWPYVFYFSGIFTMLSTILWFIFAYDTPDQHPRISEREKNFIRDSLTLSGKDPNREDLFGPSTNGQTAVKSSVKVPWKSIVTSRAFIGVACFHVSFTWAYYSLLSTFPQYLHDVHQVDMKQNGFLNCLPYMLGLLSTLVTGHILDAIVNKGLLSITATRKLVIALCGISAAISFLCITLWGDILTVAMVSFCFCEITLGISVVVFVTNFVDISPRFAGEVSSMSNCLACIPGYVAPVLTGLITNQNSSQSEWRFTFLVAACVSVWGVIMFLWLGSGEIQPWDFYYSKTKDISVNKLSTETYYIG